MTYFTVEKILRKMQVVYIRSNLFNRHEIPIFFYMKATFVYVIYTKLNWKPRHSNQIDTQAPQSGGNCVIIILSQYSIIEILKC